MKYRQLKTYPLINRGKKMNVLKKPILLLLIMLSSLLTTTSVHAIANGENATYGNQPWMGSLQIQAGNSWFHVCGVIVWKQNYVISSAHCLNNAASNYRVVLGEHDLEGVDAGEQIRTLLSYTNHPLYSANTAGYPNDISVLRLSSPLVFDAYVNPIAPLTTSVYSGEPVTITGWGQFGAGTGPATILQTAGVPTISNAECANHWSAISGATVNSGHICLYEAGIQPAAACAGDSGGPAVLVNGEILLGSASWGSSNCLGNYPSVYTRISAYTAWLAANTGG